MAFINEFTVATGPATLIWDGLSKPEPVAATAQKPATVKYSVKVAIPADAPEYAELYQLEQAAIRKDYPGGAPARFQGAFSQANESGKVPEVNGQIAFNCATFGNFPDVFDMNGQMLDAAAVGRILYAGAKVRVLVTGRTYDSNGNKGSGFYLSGLQIVDANPATAPKLAVSAGMTTAQVANAFGIQTPGAAFAATAVPPVPGAPVGAPPVPGVPGVPPVPQAPAAAVAAPPPVPAAPVAVAPNPGILGAPPVPGVPGVPPVPQAPAAPPAPAAAPAGPVMTPAAGGIPYESYIAQGWTDAQLIQNGLMHPL